MEKTLDNTHWRRYGENVQAGLEFMLQGEHWHYIVKEQIKVIEWCEENLTDAHYWHMASDDVGVVFDWKDADESVEWNSRLCIKVSCEEDAMAFKLRWV